MQHKPSVIFGYDLGSKDYNSEVIIIIRPDGKMEVTSIHQWNKELTLTTNNYRTTK